MPYLVIVVVVVVVAASVAAAVSINNSLRPCWKFGSLYLVIGNVFVFAVVVVVVVVVAIVVVVAAATTAAFFINTSVRQCGNLGRLSFLCSCC